MRVIQLESLDFLQSVETGDGIISFNQHSLNFGDICILFDGLSASFLIIKEKSASSKIKEYKVIEKVECVKIFETDTEQELFNLKLNGEFACCNELLDSLSGLFNDLKIHRFLSEITDIVEGRNNSFTTETFALLLELPIPTKKVTVQKEMDIIEDSQEQTFVSSYLFVVDSTKYYLHEKLIVYKGGSEYKIDRLLSINEIIIFVTEQNIFITKKTKSNLRIIRSIDLTAHNTSFLNKNEAYSKRLYFKKIDLLNDVLNDISDSNQIQDEIIEKIKELLNIKENLNTKCELIDYFSPSLRSIYDFLIDKNYDFITVYEAIRVLEPLEYNNAEKLLENDRVKNILDKNSELSTENDVLKIDLLKYKDECNRLENELSRLQATTHESNHFQVDNAIDTNVIKPNATAYTNGTNYSVTNLCSRKKLNLNNNVYELDNNQIFAFVTEASCRLLQNSTTAIIVGEGLPTSGNQTFGKNINSKIKVKKHPVHLFNTINEFECVYIGKFEYNSHEVKNVMIDSQKSRSIIEFEMIRRD